MRPAGPVTLAKVNITPGTGGMASVKLTYSTPKETEEDEEGSGNPGVDEEKLKKFKSSCRR